ncbi:MAG: toprim domain-containing protein, partial [Cyanobacteria bacterium REEB65]|nr:toprim domain-containing protein [Cyanobacteria bacterium REEB65]
MSRVNLADIKARLLSHSLDVGRLVQPNGRRAGRRWVAKSASGRQDGWALILSGSHCGFKFEGASKPQHVFELLVEHEGSFEAALARACEILGIDPEADASAMGTCKRDPLHAAKAPTLNRLAPETQAAINKAWGLWKRAEPLPGTQAEAYLRGRGIYLDRWPADLKFLPRWKDHLPAMLAKVTGPDGGFMSVQRTLLDRDGFPRKASEEQRTVPDPDRTGETITLKPKLSAKDSPVAGGAIRLAPAGPRLIVAEGVETALSAALLLGPDLPAWACLGGCLPGVVLPPEVRDVVIAADDDTAKTEPGR